MGAFSLFDGGLYPVGATSPPPADPPTVGYGLLGMVGFQVGSSADSGPPPPPLPPPSMQGGGGGPLFMARRRRPGPSKSPSFDEVDDEEAILA